MNRVTLSLLLALTLCGGFIPPVSAAAQEPTYIEGHVFSKLTGVPLVGAWVTAVEVRPFVTGVFPPPEPRVVTNVMTDDSGFYSFEHDGVFDLLLEAICPPFDSGRQGRILFPRGTTVSPIRPGTIRRDLYVDVGRRRNRPRCVVFTVDPPLVPLAP